MTIEVDFSALLREAEAPVLLNVDTELTAASALLPPRPGTHTVLQSQPSVDAPLPGQTQTQTTDPQTAVAPLPGEHGAPPFGSPLPDSFASQVADALHRLSPTSGQDLETHQVPPPEHDDPSSSVTGWVLQAGRNAGKTYAGARWLHRRCTRYPGTRARIIAPSFADAVASCVEGPSGILAASDYTVVWKPSHPGGAQLIWPNGSVAYVMGTFTPRDVDRLRALGNIDVDWFEEAAANTQLVEAERQARLSRRRQGAKWIATTTPRPLKVLRDWKKDPSVRISHATAHDNPHADPLWLEELERMYRGTRLYAQEVLGQVLEDVEGALWAADNLDRSRIRDLSDLYAHLEASGHTITRAAVGVDPANSTGTTGIVAVCMSDDRHLYVVEDGSLQGRTAEQWSRAAVDLAVKWKAVLVPENDSGGDAIRAVLKAADLLDEVSIFPARARGVGSKGVRAEPISLLWERDDFRAHLVGSHPQLEDQMLTFVPDLTGQESPDRLDAMVWACTYLWSRASFEQVTSNWPNSSYGKPGAVQLRRPGEVLPWRSTKAKGRHKKETAG